jgi:hypothetical protein
MENILFLLSASLAWYTKARKFQRTIVGETGSSLLFAPGAEFEATSNDGDTLYFSEHEEKNITYGVVIASLAEELCYDDTLVILEDYLDRLRKPYHARFNTGVVSCPSRHIELEDYWQDVNLVDWKVKAYSNGKTMAFLYVKNINEAEVEKQEAFFNSFRFGNQ